MYQRWRLHQHSVRQSSTQDVRLAANAATLALRSWLAPQPSFTANGIDRIERVLTENHWSYKHSRAVANVIAELGARHVFIRPHCP